MAVPTRIPPPYVVVPSVVFAAPVGQLLYPPIVPVEVLQQTIILASYGMRQMEELLVVNTAPENFPNEP